MDCKVWKYTFVYYQKLTPANFERRLGTSLEGIDTSSLAHAKYESGRLKIRNIAIANTNKWNFNSLLTPIFVTHTQKKKILYKKKIWDQRQPETIKSQPYW